MDRQHAGIPQEKWLPIADYEGYYEISDHGMVRNVMARKNTFINRILNPRKDKDGYLLVNLYRDGKRKTMKVHRLVMAAFVGECPIGEEVNHKDGIKTHCNIGNLEYVSHHDNQRHAAAKGLMGRGERNGGVKLSENDIHDIRRLLKTTDMTHAEIGEPFGVVRATIGLIANRKNWGWLK